MNIEITSPCCLHLGFVSLNGQICELGITLQSPQIQLAARPSQQLSVSGARAEMAYQHAAVLHLTGDVEIEIAIPAHMGLGSDEMMRVAVAGSLNTKDLSDPLGLHEHAFARGGLLLIGEDGQLLKRATISHIDDEDAWVFVLVLPSVPDGIADDFEAQQRAALHASAQHLRQDVNANVLFDAINRDDFSAFAVALAQIRAANAAAFAANGHPIELTDQDHHILELMRANGVAFAGRALTGLGLFGLIKGASASRALRKALVDNLGYFGPLVMGSICDNQAAQIKTN